MAERGPAASIEEALNQLLQEHDRCWAKLDFEGVAALWDESDPECTYSGDEYQRPQVGWSELQAHWARLDARLKGATVTSTLSSSRSIASDIALAVLLSAWELFPIEASAPQRGHHWVTLLLRAHPDGWKIFHYVELPTHVASQPSGDDER